MHFYFNLSVISQNVKFDSSWYNFFTLYCRSLSRSGSVRLSGSKRGKHARRKRGRRKSSGRRLSSAFSGVSAITSSTSGLRAPSQASSRSAEKDALKIHKEVIEQVRYILYETQCMDKKWILLKSQLFESASQPKLFIVGIRYGR